MTAPTVTRTTWRAPRPGTDPTGPLAAVDAIAVEQADADAVEEQLMNEVTA